MRKPRFIPLESAFAAAPKIRTCDHEDCECAGDFRAPKSPYRLNEYFWFCLDHVREYNKRWDFYQGMSTEEIEASRISDITWNRPSWPVGGWRTLLESVRYLDGIDPFLKVPPQVPSLPQPVQKAMGVLELALPITLECLKKQYKKLAKRHHPDLNPKDKQAEERLKVINEAYRVVKKHLTA
ncbi:MAG: J domain-containing protein [Proteobacteria bacterium]|nr:J domain-containing protein [Pseudomonadota bacterium]